MTAAPVQIALERFTAETFSPFGWPIAVGTGEPVFQAEHIRSWAVPFEVDDRLHLMLAWYRHLPFRFSSIERHVAVTQAFVPLAGAASVMVVAAGGPETIPQPKSFRAFLVPGDVGIVLRRNAWHALTRFPAGPGDAAFALLTSAATQAELEEQKRSGRAPTLTTVIDYADTGTSFEVVDPSALLKA